MSEELIVRHCSPTLAGLKTGSLFSCAVSTREELTRSLCRLNKKLVPRGLRVIPLRYRGGRALIYVYRPSGLRRDLDNGLAREILEKNGYEPEDADGCVTRLSRRVKDNEQFPHEIGLFLSYPPEDVCGFINNKACDHKCVGCWKVYGDEEQARKTFARYEKCARVYADRWYKGRSLERLAVAG